MLDSLAPGAIWLAVAAFIVIALGTTALALLVEGIRRWMRYRSAANAIRRLTREPQIRSAIDGSSLLAEQDYQGPAWLAAIVLRLPHREDVQRLIDQAGVRNASLGSIFVVSVGLAVALGVIGLVLIGDGAPALLLAAVGAYLPIAFLKFRRKRRFAAFEEGFPEAIDLLARAARAGHSLSSGFAVVGDEGEEPVASEFKQVFEEQRFGLPIQDALLGLADRVDLVDVRIFVTAVLIQRESGGNLAENLDGLSSVIRGRFRFKRDVKTKTAHGKITGIVVALAPVVAGVGMFMINPTYMSPMITEPLGRMMLFVGVCMMLFGFLIIRRMVDIKY